MIRVTITRFVGTLIATTAMFVAVAGAAIEDAYQLHVTTQQVGALIVHGAPGSVNPDSTVLVENLSQTSGSSSSISRDDGSFSITVNGVPGDVLRITDESAASIEITASTITIKNPYTSSGNWFIGQGHTHTNETDGADLPHLVEAVYYQAGYDFVVSTDHRGISPHYLQDDDGMTPDPDNSGIGKDLLWISGSELSLSYAHLGAWGQSERIAVLPLLYGISESIEALRAAGGLAVINHPENKGGARAWEWHSEIVPNENFSMVEAFNGKHPPEQTGSEHIKDAIDLADAYRQIWWIGTDDTHSVYDPDQFDKYAIILQADQAELTKEDMLASADAGRMYIRETAAGPAIQTITTNGNRVSIKFVNSDETFRVTWKKRGGVTIAEQYPVTGTASIEVDGSEGYVRAEAERVRDGLHAYSQPLFIGNSIDLSQSASSSSLNSDRLVDNNRTSQWRAGDSTGEFTIDVGAARPVNAVRIEWAQNRGRRFNYRIIASKTGEFAGEEFQIVRNTYSNRSKLTIDFFDAYARFIKVEITGQSTGTAGQAKIREVEIFDASPANNQLWVDNTLGSDINNGTAGAPFQTLAHALEEVRPRDTLNVRNTGIPYVGPISLNARHSGTHEGARVRIAGNPAAPTEIDGRGADFAVKFDRTRYLDWSHFDVHSAVTANILTLETEDLLISGNNLRNSLRRGMQGTGSYALTYNLIYDNAEEGALIYGSGTNAALLNNILDGNGRDGMKFAADATSSVEVRNNISSHNGISAFNNVSSGLVIDSHNCSVGDYLGLWTKVSSLELDSIEYRDPAVADFRLTDGSVCIDAGIDLGLHADYSGNGITDAAGITNIGSPGAHDRDYVDIGAFEFIPSCTACNGGCH